MRPFVVHIIHMTCRASGHHTQRARASASAAFTIEMWRAAMVLLVNDHTRLSVPLDIFLLTSGGYTSLLWKVVSDASPWQLAAGLYNYLSGRLFCWTTLLLSFSSADAYRFQTQREYLGHLLSVLLIVAYKNSSATAHGTTAYQWVNDNTGAIAWVNSNKCSSLASSFACMAVSQLNMLSDVWAAHSRGDDGKDRCDESARGAGRLSHRLSYVGSSNILQSRIPFCSYSLFSVQSGSRSKFPRRASSYCFGCRFFNL